jgi:two-component system sensor histidine kinase KdpD
MEAEGQRPTPEQLLSAVERDEAAARRGRLKIFVGYASGVGKTARMLAEALRRRERGEDVVVAAVQQRMPSEAASLLERLEVVPAAQGGEGIDTEALLRRRPAVCVIDGLAHDNPPGARHRSRWQDVEELVARGIGVIGSINIQYIAELAAAVEAVTGKHVTETVPIGFIQSADEVEIVDAPAGDATRLARLREMALVLAADVVDRQLNEYLERHGIHGQPGAQERILVCITPRANIGDMLETACLVAGRFHAELLAAYVRQPQITAEDQARLEAKLELARARGAQVEMLSSDDPIAALVSFARSRGVTQLFIGHSQRTGLAARLWGNPVERLIRLSRGIDVRVFPQ